MQRVIGLGGIFFKCQNLEATRAWYARHLGLQLESWGAQFFFKNDPHPDAYSVLSFFKADSAYMAPSGSPFMINFRVADLDALVIALREEGVPLIGEPVEEEFGKFAWVMDPEGNKIELWQQNEARRMRDEG
ncbi:MAG: VOC family protein [Saprospiraceae bacterium]|nr:VOC family protein [Saprospiraceae bacterium]